MGEYKYGSGSSSSDSSGGSSSSSSNEKPAPQVIDAEILDEEKLQEKPRPPQVLKVERPQVLPAFADVLAGASGVAESLGAERVAEVTRLGAAVARSAPAAVEGVKAAVKPTVEAGKKLWAAAKQHGLVGTADRPDLSENRSPKKKISAPPSSKQEGKR